MSWEAPDRNLANVQFAALRQAVEAPFHRAHDELTVAYYDHWRNGKSAPWHRYDVQPTAEASKALFDELHGLLDALRMLALDDRNAAAPARDAAFTATLAEPDERGLTLRDRLGSHIADCRARGLELDIRPSANDVQC